MINPNNLLIVTYWSFSDALIQAYTLPYVRIIRRKLPPGSLIYLFTLEQKSHALSNREKQQIASRLYHEGIIWKPFQYSPFGIKMMVKWAYILIRLIILIFHDSINTIHAWCTPAGAIGYILSRLTGRSLVLDSFEPHAEPMVEAGQWSDKSSAFRLLFAMEKKQAKHADVVIGCVDKMKVYAQEKYEVQLKKFYSKPACVNFSLFDFEKAKNEELLTELGLNDKVVCVYAGKFGGSYLKQEVFDFFRTCYDQWGEVFRVLLLSAHSRDEVEKWALCASVPPELIIQQFVPHSDVPAYIGLGDFAIVPFVPVPSKRYGSPIKTGEYMAMGLPIVITKDISDDSDLIVRDNIGDVLQQLNREEYQKAVQKIDRLLGGNQRVLQKRIAALAHELKSFDHASAVYDNIYCKEKKTEKYHEAVLMS
ncbi:MAG: glycosyltransferase [Bacteroidota bacterium]